MRRKKGKKNYIFTNRVHPLPAIMGTILGCLGILSWIYAIFGSYAAGGAVTGRFGVAGALSVLYALIGLILGIHTLRQQDIYRIFPILAVVLNTVSLLVGGFLLWIPA